MIDKYMGQISHWLNELLVNRFDIKAEIAGALSTLLLTAAMIAVGLFINWILQAALRWISKDNSRLARSKWHPFIVRRKLGHHILLIIPGIILYMLPYLIGSPVILLFHLLVSAMRGFHDTKTGMWMTLLSVPIQILVCWGGYSLFGIAGLGYGTLTAQTAGCLLGFWRIRPHFQTEQGHESLPQGSVKEFAALAIPVSLSKAIMPAAHAAINPLVLSIGAVYVSASGLAGRFEGFFYLAAMSMGSVAITMGAGDSQRYSTKKLLRHLCLWSMAPSIVMVILAWIFAEPFWAQLTPDPFLQRSGVEYWRICLLAYPLISLEMTLTGILQAKGQGMPTLVITVVRTWGIQLPITWAAIPFGWGAKGAWMAYLLGNLVSVLIIGAWTYIKLGHKSPFKKTR